MATASDDGPRGHAMLRVRPKHWAAVLQEFELGWAEGNRRACLGNFGPLSNVARAFDAAKPEAVDLVELTAELYGARLFCPEHGQYQRTADGHGVQCSVHGSTAAPRQPRSVFRWWSNP